MNRGMRNYTKIFIASVLSSARRPSLTLTMTFPPTLDKTCSFAPIVIPKFSKCRLFFSSTSTFLTVSSSPSGAIGNGIRQPPFRPITAKRRAPPCFSERFFCNSAISLKGLSLFSVESLPHLTFVVKQIARLFFSFSTNFIFAAFLLKKSDLSVFYKNYGKRAAPFKSGSAVVNDQGSNAFFFPDHGRFAVVTVMPV